MLSKIRHINPYAVAVLSVCGATLLTHFFYPLLVSVSFTLFYAAIALSAWIGGIKPGSLAILLSLLSSHSFFLSGVPAPAIAEPNQWMRLSLVAVVSFLISYLISELRDAQHQIQQLSHRRLQESEEQLRLAMRAAHLGIWNWNLITGEITWSPEHEQLFGLAPGSFDGRYETFDDRLYPDDREGLSQAVQTALQGHSIYQHEYRIIWADGSMHWVEGRGQAFYDEAGNPIRMTGTIMDIGDRKRLEIALTQSEQQFRTIFEAEPECVKVITAEGIVQNMNPAGLAMLEADTLEQVQGRYVCSLIEPAHQSAFLNFTQRVAQGETATLEFEITGLKGTRRWVESHAVSLQTLDEANPLILAITRDVTEQKRAEAIIQRSEERYRSLVTATFQIVWTADAEGHTTSVSPTWFEVTGQDWADLQQWSWIDYLHPEDRDRAIDVWQQAVSTQITYDAEYRLRAKEGSYRDFKVRGVPIKNPDGSIREWIGTLTDITELKQAEIALLQSKLELEQRVAERTAELQRTNDLLNSFFNAASSAAIGLCIHDRNLRFIQINEALADMNGHSVSAHLGKTTAELLPELAPVFNPLLQQVLTTGQPILDLEISAEALNQPGTTRYWLASYFPILASDRQTQTVGVGVIVIEISDRKRAEQALEKELVQSKALFQASFDGIVVLNQQGDVVDASESFAQMLGYSLEETLKLHAVDWDAQWTREELVQNIQGSKLIGVPFETLHRRRDGSVYEVEVSVNDVKLANEVLQVCICRDISERQATLRERKRAEAVLVEADRRWRSLLDNVQLIVVGLDSNGNVEYINPFFLQLTGYTEKEVLGKYWFTHFLPPSQQPDVEVCFQEVLEQDFHAHYQNSIVTRLGEERMIAWSNTLLRNVEGRPVGTISIGEDITERYKLELMKAEFISIVSHELRTPLTSISGALELLSTGLIQPESERGQETIAIAATEADRLTRLVNDILDLERLESGKIRLECQPWDLAQLMSHAADFMQLAASQTEITLAVAPLSVILDVDGDRILQVLTNLLSNAVKFSPDHSTIWLTAQICREPDPLSAPSPQASFPHPTSSLHPASSPHPPVPYVLITVRDQGRGIPVSKLESIFERFQQVDASDSRKKGGTGLGLAICRSIVQQHGGNIWAESALNQGSSFHFTLPISYGP